MVYLSGTQGKMGLLLRLMPTATQTHPTIKECITDNTDSSKSEWENPFATKHGGNQDNNESCFHLNEDDDELPYPKFVRQVERILANEVAYPTNDKRKGKNGVQLQIIK
ncbi:hypothetical protein Tco_1039107 [Tanacetum coccineum]